MDDSAIKRIEALTSLRELHTDVPSIVLPPGCTIKSLEEFGLQPKRQVVNLTVRTIDDFCAYIIREHGPDGSTAVLISPSFAGAVGVIDFGSRDNPMWKSHRICLKMRKSPALEALEDFCAASRTQEELIEYIEDWWSDLSISCADGGREIPTAAAVTALRSVTIEQLRKANLKAGDFESRRSSLDEVRASSGAGRLPGRMALSCQPFEGMSERVIYTRISILTGKDKPHFRVRIVGLDDLTERCKREVSAKIKEALGDTDVRVFVGEL